MDKRQIVYTIFRLIDNFFLVVYVHNLNSDSFFLYERSWRPFTGCTNCKKKDTKIVFYTKISVFV